MTSPVPNKDTWWSVLSEWAGYLNTYMQGLTNDSGDALVAQFYDGEECAWQLIEHFGTNATYAALRLKMYEVYNYYTNTTASPAGAVAGYRQFTEGFLQDVLRSSAQSAAAAANIEAILLQGAYMDHGDCEDANNLVDGGSREAAYALKAFLDAVKSGNSLSAPQIARRQVHFEWALGHLDQWFTNESALYVSNFMVGLTARSLIQYWDEVEQDPRILEKLTLAGDMMWDDSWKASAGSWGDGSSFLYRKILVAGPDGGYYDSSVDPFTQPDLNMLIAPLYGWLWYETGDTKWRIRGDEIFAGSISVYDEDGFHQSGAYLGSHGNPSGKQYNQQLTWGPEYIRWAESDPVNSETPGVAPTNSPSGHFFRRR